MRLLLVVVLLALAAWGQETIESLNTQAVKLYTEGRYQEAEPLVKRAMTLAEASLGAEHPTTALIWHYYTILQGRLGRPSEAVEAGQRTLALRERLLGRDHLDTVATVHVLSLMQYYAGRLDLARPLARRALSVRLERLGENSPDTADTLLALGIMATDASEYPEAEGYLKRALEAYRAAGGESDVRLVQSYNALGRLYQRTGAFARAEDNYKAGLDLRRRLAAMEHPDASISLNNLADLYRDIGSYAQAESLYREALALCKRLLGPNHPDTAICMNNLAVCLSFTLLGSETTDMAALYAKASEIQKLYADAMVVAERAKGPDSEDVAVRLNNLAQFIARMAVNKLSSNPQRDFARAESYSRRALAIYSRLYGPEHPEIAKTMSNLATLYMMDGQSRQAEPLLLKALAMRRKSLGERHPDTLLTFDNLAFLSLDLERPQDSLGWARKASEARASVLADVFSFTSEAQRLSFQSTWRPYDIFATFGSAPDLAQAILRYKGIVLDSLVEDLRAGQASSDPARRAQAAALRTAGERLVQLTANPPKDQPVEQLDAERERLRAEVEALQAALADAGPGQTRRSLTVTVEQVQRALPRESSLVEFVQYSRYGGNNRWETNYGAVVIPPTGPPAWVALGLSKPIDAAIGLYKARVRGLEPARAVRLQTAAAPTSPAEAVLRDLYLRLWAPVEKSLPAGTRLVILSPDSQLSFVSFATLVDPAGRFLAEKHLLAYVASGRDLVTVPQPSQVEEMVVFANPDFGTPVVAGTGAPARSLTSRELAGVAFNSLPGTAREAAILVKMARRNGVPCRAFEGPLATEAQVRQLKSPRILHLATHGFFLPEDVQAGSAMQRSGVALAGAQTTLEAWRSARPPVPDTDGILTAQEVGSLDLAGTWLVCLSACDTGTGEARGGEGVLGLRRGIIQAGAQNLVITLWPVADQETASFMVDFYEAVSNGGSAPLALARVQRDWLVRLRRERSVGAALTLAGPFVLTFQGPLPQLSTDLPPGYP